MDFADLVACRLGQVAREAFIDQGHVDGRAWRIEEWLVCILVHYKFSSIGSVLKIALGGISTPFSNLIDNSGGTA